MQLLKKIFDHEYKELERFKRIADEIELLDSQMSELTDKQLKNKTKEFKERIEKGETGTAACVERQVRKENRSSYFRGFV